MKIGAPVRWDRPASTTLATTVRNGRPSCVARGKSGASGGAATSCRFGVSGLGPSTLSARLFSFLPDFRDHAEILARQRLWKSAADRSNFSGRPFLPPRRSNETRSSYGCSTLVVSEVITAEGLCKKQTIVSLVWETDFASSHRPGIAMGHELSLLDKGNDTGQQHQVTNLDVRFHVVSHGLGNDTDNLAPILGNPLHQ